MVMSEAFCLFRCARLLSCSRFMMVHSDSRPVLSSRSPEYVAAVKLRREGVQSVRIRSLRTKSETCHVLCRACQTPHYDLDAKK